jgi:hypothetical protein
MESFYFQNKDASYLLERVVPGSFPLYLHYEFVHTWSPSPINISGPPIIFLSDALISSKHISPLYFKKDDKLQALPSNAKKIKSAMLRHFGDNDYVKNIAHSDSLIFNNVIEIFNHINSN